MGAAAVRIRPWTPERARDALSYCSPDCSYEDWIAFGQALHSEWPDETGLDLWCEWSSFADSFPGRKDLEARWRGFRSGGGRTMAFVHGQAKARGWHDDARPVQIDPAEAERRRVERAEREAQVDAELQVERAAAAERAAAIWGAAEPAVNHPYLDAKGILSHGTRVGRWDVVDRATGEVKTLDERALLIPAQDFDGRIWTLECILTEPLPDGRNKLFLRGGAKSGHFFRIGDRPVERHGRPIFVVSEGFATGASIHECTRHQVIVCFDAGNLAPVARELRVRHPEAVILLAADNDQFGARNSGMEAARKAAAEVGGLVALPEFADLDGNPTDFNDLHQREGAIAVIEQIVAGLKSEPIVPEPAAAPVAGDALLADFEQAMDETSAGGAGARGNEPADAGKSLSVATVQRDQKRPVFGTPIDLFNVSEPPQVPLSVLPDSIAAYAKDQSELLGSDPSIVAVVALAAAAAVIDDGVVLQPKRRDPTWTESARLWVGIVGDPSTKKSPSISKAVRHIKRLESRLAEQNGAAYGDWKHRHEQWKEMKKASKGQDVPPEPEQPPMRRLIVEDTTVEALSEILKDNPRGVLCLQDELTGWFAGMDAYRGGGGKGANKDRAHWLEIYNGGRRSIDRVTRGSIVVPNWSACMVGGIQPEMIRRIASGMGNDGLLQRFMIVVARAAQKGIDRYPDHEAMDRFAALFDHLEGISPSQQPVTMTEGAHQARERIEDLATRMSQAFDQPHLKAWLGKWEGLFARLVLTYHVIECAEAGDYPNQRQVRGETAEQVEQLMCGVLLPHAVHFYNEVIDSNDRQSNMRQLARLILARGMTVVTKRDIHIYWRASRKLQPWEVKAVIDGLCGLDWLCPDETSLDAADGKPKSWFVNPAVHEAFAGHAERERARRDEVVATMREIKAAFATGHEAVEQGEAEAS